MSRLLEVYNNEIKIELKTKLGLKNLFEVPKIEKIILNMGIGDGKEDSKQIDKALEDLMIIMPVNTSLIFFCSALASFSSMISVARPESSLMTLP